LAGGVEFVALGLVELIVGVVFDELVGGLVEL
jgi:hypothetical protein